MSRYYAQKASYINTLTRILNDVSQNHRRGDGLVVAHADKGFVDLKHILSNHLVIKKITAIGHICYLVLVHDPSKLLQSLALG